jgi:hypothetical protein
MVIASKCPIDSHAGLPALYRKTLITKLEIIKA